MRLLVIDDHEDYCQLIQTGIDLCKHDYEIECRFTDSGTKALEFIKNWEPSVVLLDPHVADIHSCKILECCRDGYSTVVVTADGRSAEIETSVLAQGAKAYVPKIDSADEVEVMMHWLVSISDDTLLRH